MARFITTVGSCFDLDKIVYIDFTPEYTTILSIQTTIPGVSLDYRNNVMDRRAMRCIIRDIRHHFVDSYDQPESFWQMINAIERWLDEEDKKDG